MRGDILKLCDFCERTGEKVCYYSSDYPCQKKSYYKGYKNQRQNRLKAQKKYRSVEENRIKNRCRVKTAYLIKYGKIVNKEECENCYSEEKLEKHHPDYSDPFNVLWLCKSCHENLHHYKVEKKLLINS